MVYQQKEWFLAGTYTKLNKRDYAMQNSQENQCNAYEVNLSVHTGIGSTFTVLDLNHEHGCDNEGEVERYMTN